MKQSSSVPRHEAGAAELARTALRSAPVLDLRCGGDRWDVALHAATRDGRPELLVPGRGPLRALLARSTGPLPATIDAVDLSPVPVTDRVRCTARLHGTLDVVPSAERAAAIRALTERCTAESVGALGPDVSVLRLDVVRVRVHAAGVLPPTGAEVDLGRYAVATPDPVLDHEARVLTHVLRSHPEELALTCRLLDREVVRNATTMVPTGLDRFGFVIAVHTPDGVRRARLPFPAPLRRIEDLQPAMAALLRRAALQSAAERMSASR